MAKLKIDGIVQAVHYNSDGLIAWVRAYIRRGPTFSDRIMVDRQTLINQIKKGGRYYLGERQPLMASTFEVNAPVRILEKNGRELLIAGVQEADQDFLEGTPLI